MSRADPAIVLAHWDGLDLFDDDALARLASVGRLLDAQPLASWTDPRADALLAEAEVVVGHWGCPPLDADMLDRTPNLGLFAYAAGTVKGSVTEALWERSVRVTSGANANAEPVAEFTLAAILFANKDVLWRRGAMDTSATASALSGSAETVAVGNYDKTIGIVGASLIGRRVIELLHAFPRLQVTLYDPFVTAEEAAALGAAKLDLDELCTGCDILSIHAPALPSTLHMIGARELAALRDGATIINTARGPLIDHDAMLPELVSGRLRAILDVTDPEPLPADSPLRELPNVWLSPHLAGSQGTELRRMIDYAVDEVRRWSTGEPARNEITEDLLGRLA